jgi:hypothetical protein
MAQRYKKLTQQDIRFINEQKLFYLASCSDKEVNLSPKGFDSLYILDAKNILFYHMIGSTNRTYHDTIANGNFTLLFNAFEGSPRLLRVFCKATIIEPRDENYQSYIQKFEHFEPSLRNLILFTIEAVEPSCGEGVPIMEYKGDRDSLPKWYKQKHEDGKLKEYEEKHFQRVDLKDIK